MSELQVFTYRFHLKLKFPQVDVSEYVARLGQEEGMDVIFGTSGYLLVEFRWKAHDANTALKAILPYWRSRIGNVTTVMFADRMKDGVVEKRVVA